MNDLISLVITTYGGDSSLIRAINSVLNQTYKNFEIIVVDDNDPNTEQRHKTEQMMSAFIGINNIKYIQHPKNMNGSVARNTGISYAEGKYISFLDDDDILLPTRFERAIKAMTDHPEYDGVCCDVVKMRSGLICSISSRPDGDTISYDNFFEHYSLLGTGSNLFLKKDIIKKVDGFDPRFNRFQDVEFMLRVCKEGTVAWQSGVGIIKDKSRARILDYRKTRDAYTLFNEKFSEELQRTGDKCRDSLEADVTSDLWGLAKLSQNKDYVLEQLNNAKKYNLLSFADRLLSGNIDVFINLWFSLKRSKFYYAYSLVNKLREYRIDLSNRKLLTKEEVGFIKDMLRHENQRS